MESQRIEFTLEDDPLKTVPSNRRGAQQMPKLSLTDTEYVSVMFGGRNISIATLLFSRRLQLSCTRKLTGNIYLRCSLFLLPHFGFSQLSYTCVEHSREAVNGIPLNIEQGISTGEMRRACVKLMRALLGQSAQAHSVNLNPHPYQTWRFGLCRVIDVVTIEINSPN